MMTTDRMGGTPTDAASIAASPLRLAGARHRPPDPRRDNASGQAGVLGAKQSRDTNDYSHSLSKVNHSIDAAITGPLPLLDLGNAEVICPIRHAGSMPVLCEVDCAAWRGQRDGLGYCALISGERGPI